MTSQASLSLSLLLTKVTHAQYRKRFRASYNKEKLGKRLHRDCFAHSMTCVHLASRAQSVSSFLTRLELRMFELRLWVLREAFESQRACLRRKPAALALIPDDEAWEVQSWVKWVLSLLVLSLYRFFQFSVILAEGQWATTSTEQAPATPGRTLKGNFCREGCCWRCPRVDVQGSSSWRSTFPATMQK